MFCWRESGTDRQTVLVVQLLRGLHRETGGRVCDLVCKLALRCRPRKRHDRLPVFLRLQFKFVKPFGFDKGSTFATESGFPFSLLHEYL